MDGHMNDPDPEPAPLAPTSNSSPFRPRGNFLCRTLGQHIFRLLPWRARAHMSATEALPDLRDVQGLTVSELMRPAHEMVYLSAANSDRHNLDIIERTRFSRYPFFADDGETLLGMVHFKDLFPLSPRGADFKAILRRPLVVPPDTSIAGLFARFRQGGSHFALVGYPGEHADGFLTLDNVLGAMIGEIRDEFRRDGGNWNRLDDGSLLGRGSMSLFSLKHELGIELPDSEADSIGGLVMEKLGRLPNEGERIPFGLFDVVVKRMQGPRILLLKVMQRAAAGNNSQSRSSSVT
jgi:CBS domain containing-hemolysin-like protein